MNRREFLAAAAIPCLGLPPKQARIAITLDLEMSRNFPRWEDTHWDYEKGNLNAETKAYAREACRRIKAAGGVAHCFLVGRALEQEDVRWLKEIAQAGHSIGNHTYDHVNIRATTLRDLQFRFQRAPWLVQGKSVLDVIAENIRLTNAAIQDRLGIAVAGFRSPGGFHDGLVEFPQVRRLLRDLGFSWVSTKYPPGAVAKKGIGPDAAFFRELEVSLAQAQPYAYSDGLLEIPMSPISDIVAFRTGQWKLDWFLEAIDHALDWAIERGSVFDFLGHPSCLYVMDPEFRTMDRILRKVAAAGAKAKLASLDEIASSVAAGVK